MKFPSNVMCRVFEWGYKNGIDVSLMKYRRHDGDYPVLRFQHGNKTMERGFYDLTTLAGELEYVWRDIALQLCVEPLNLENLGG